MKAFEVAYGPRFQLKVAAVSTSIKRHNLQYKTPRVWTSRAVIAEQIKFKIALLIIIRLRGKRCLVLLRFSKECFHIFLMFG